jgi:hypothetical protein
MMGIVIHAKWLPEGGGKPCRNIVAVDGGHENRICIATTGTNTADYLLGRVAVVDVEGAILITSNQEERPILDLKVTPDELGLPENWQTTLIHARPTPG